MLTHPRGTGPKCVQALYYVITGMGLDEAWTVGRKNLPSVRITCDILDEAAGSDTILEQTDGIVTGKGGSHEN